jgi:phosphoglucosamine mutase
VNDSGELFGTDGIRGEANRFPLDAATVFAVGQAVVQVLKRSGSSVKVVIGRDTRISGSMLESVLESGVISMGGTPYLVGVLPTPGIAHVTRSIGADAGVVISASHNPYQDNGIKIFSGLGLKLSDDEETEIERLVLGKRLPEMMPPPCDIGLAHRVEDAESLYLRFLKGAFPAALTMQGMKAVLDTANGATYRVAPAIFAGLGAQVTVIHNAPNGANINDDCGSQHTADLRRAVVECGADIGLAFDGDGDRLVAVDEKGGELKGDQILIICAEMLKAEGRLSNDIIVSTVMSNLGLRVACKEYGLMNYASQVGDRHVLEHMQRLGAVLGGEESGHVIFLDHHTTGDGVLAGLQLVAAMLKAGKPLSELAKLMQVFPQKLINIEVKSKPEIDSVSEIVEAIARVEGELGDHGRVLVRYSGTQSMCRVMVEGPTAEITEKCAGELADVVKSVIG